MAEEGYLYTIEQNYTEEESKELRKNKRSLKELLPKIYPK